MSTQQAPDRGNRPTTFADFLASISTSAQRGRVLADKLEALRARLQTAMCAHLPFRPEQWSGSSGTRSARDIRGLFDGNVVLQIDADDAPPCFVTISRSLAHLLIDRTLGGDGQAPTGSQARALSQLDRDLLFHTATIVSDVLAHSEAPESVPRNVIFPATIPTPAASDYGLVRLELAASPAANFLCVTIPRMPDIATETATAADVEADDAQPLYQRGIMHGFQKADITLRALIRGPELTLRDIAEFRPGQLLLLNTNAEAAIILEANERPIFACKLGQIDGHYSATLQSPWAESAAGVGAQGRANG